MARLESGQEERQQQERLLAQQVEHERQADKDLAKRRQSERTSEDRHVEGRVGRGSEETEVRATLNYITIANSSNPSTQGRSLTCASFPLRHSYADAREHLIGLF